MTNGEDISGQDMAFAELARDLGISEEDLRLRYSYSDLLPGLDVAQSEAFRGREDASALLRAGAFFHDLADAVAHFGDPRMGMAVRVLCWNARGVAQEMAGRAEEAV